MSYSIICVFYGGYHEDDDEDVVGFCGIFRLLVEVFYLKTRESADSPLLFVQFFVQFFELLGVIIPVSYIFLD